MRRARFTEHYNEYFSLVCGTLYSKTGDIHASEDMAQEIFTALYEKYDTIRKVRQWLNAAVTYALRNHFSKKQNSPEYIDNSFLENSFIDESLSSHSTVHVLNQAIDSIEGCVGRVLFELILIQKYTKNEAAEALGLTTRQVRYRYGQALRQVVNYLETCGIKSTGDLQ